MQEKAEKENLTQVALTIQTRLLDRHLMTGVTVQNQRSLILSLEPNN